VSALLRGIGAALLDFFRKGCSSLAASIAFFFLLSFLPLMCLLLYGFGHLCGYDQASVELLRGAVGAFFPALDLSRLDLSHEVLRLSNQVGVQWAVVIAFAWAAMQVFRELDLAVNKVFETDRKRHPIGSTILSIVLLGLAQFVFLASYVVTRVFDSMAATAPRTAELNRLASAARVVVLGRVLPFVMVLGIVALLYRLLPRTKPRWRRAFTGALLFTLLWELAKNFFASYVLRSSRYGQMYGSLLAIVLAMLWVYYSAAIFLFCAAVVHRLRPGRT
jgi:membrane protein